MLDPALLRLIAVVADTGSLAGAADLLSITPAGVTQQIARLERALGGPVCVRGPRGTSLTPLGRALLPFSHDIQTATFGAEQSVARHLHLVEHRLRVGAFPTAAFHLVAPALTSLGHRHKALDLDIREIESVDAQRLISEDRLDVAIRSRFDEDDANEPGLAHRLLLDDPLVLVLPDNHPVALSTPADGVVPLRRVAKDPWVATSHGGAARRQFDRLAADAGFRPDIRCETESYDVAQAMVGAGVAVSLVSRLAIRHVPGTTFRAVSADNAIRRIDAVIRDGDAATPLVDEFLALVLDVSADTVGEWRLR